MIIQHFKSEDIQKNVESKTKNKLRMKHYSEICKIACKYFDLNSNEQTERLIETMYKQHVVHSRFGKNLPFEIGKDEKVEDSSFPNRK